MVSNQVLAALMVMLPVSYACFGGLGSMGGCCPPSSGMNCGLRPPCSSSQYVSSYSYNPAPVHLPPILKKSRFSATYLPQSKPLQRILQNTCLVFS